MRSRQAHSISSTDFCGRVGKRAHVVRRFDDHFVRADAVHAVEKAVAFAIQAAFNSQRGKFIRHHAQRPSRRVFAAAIPSVGENFGRGFAFIAGAERDKTQLL